MTDPILAGLFNFVINKVWDVTGFVISDSAQRKRKLELLKTKLMVAKITLDLVGLKQVMNQSNRDLVRKLTNLCYQIEDKIARVPRAKYIPGLCAEIDLKLLETLEPEVRGLAADTAGSSVQGNTNVVPSLVAGRQNDKNNIVELLLRGDAIGVSIVGMPGLGKTALARSIQEDSRIMEHFPIIFWEFAADGPANFNSTMFGDARNCLLVIDDLQDDNQWGGIICSVQRQHQCTVLITTRDRRVVSLTETTPYYLKLISDEDCRTLVRNLVSPALRSSTDINYFRQFEIDHIAKICMGLPSVAQVVARKLLLLLRNSPSAQNAIATLMAYDFMYLVGFELFRSLRLEIPRMQAQNKLLAYFILFPHGHILDKEVAFQLWTAEGFINPEKWDCLKATAHEYIQDILSASMIETQDLTSYKVLQITRMFAEAIPSNMCFCIEDEDGGRSTSNHPPSDTRHIAVWRQSIGEDDLVGIIKRIKDLRTFLCLPKDSQPTISTRVLHYLFKKLSVMRVLDLSGCGVAILPPSIGNLNDLRYLDLSQSTIKILPDSFCKLLALRILNLSGCSNLKKLPDKFSKLVNLIHLYSTCTNFSSIPPNLGKLKKVQTFHQFIVGESRCCSITELSTMNELSGSIEIMHLENVKDKDQAKRAKLHLKTSLTSLKLHWKKGSMPHQSPDSTKILDELKPPEYLSELQVINYNGSQCPRWFADFQPIRFQLLQKLHLENWPHCRNLPPFWSLPNLMELRLDSIHGVTRVGSQFLGGNQHDRFKSLQWFELSNLNNLAAWDDLVEGDMPCLKTLKICNCQHLYHMASLVLLTSLKELEISKCQQLKQKPDIPSQCSCYFDG